MSKEWRSHRAEFQRSKHWGRDVDLSLPPENEDVLAGGLELIESHLLDLGAHMAVMRRHLMNLDTKLGLIRKAMPAKRRAER